MSDGTPRLLKAYRPDGTVRCVWRDELAAGLRRRGFVPRRAGRVEVVPDGPHRGRFYVDLSPLAERAGDRRLCVCLTRTFAGYTAAVAAEVRFVERFWVVGYRPDDPAAYAGLWPDRDDAEQV